MAAEKLVEKTPANVQTAKRKANSEVTAETSVEKSQKTPTNAGLAKGTAHPLSVEQQTVFAQLTEACMGDK